MAAEETGQRTSARMPIELRVEYRRMNAFFADYTKNISRGGTFIGTDKPLSEGTRFRFLLSVPEREEPFALEGEVVWRRETGEEPGMGIRFVYADESARTEFEAIVEGWMAERLGRALAEQLLGRGLGGLAGSGSA